MGTPQTSPGTPVWLQTTDGGGTWKLLRPVVPKVALDDWTTRAFELVTPSLGFAYFDPDEYPALGPAILRTSDGGARWTPLHVPWKGATTGLDFLSPSVGYATGFGRGRCAGELWKTIDGGDSWKPVTASCAPLPVTSVQFLGPRLGFEGGGLNVKYAGPHEPQTFLRRTEDGWMPRGG